MAPNDYRGRPRVYITIRRGERSMVRVLDLAFMDGTPVAVLTWVNMDGTLQVDKHIPLDPSRLRKAAPLGAFQYDGIAVDPH